GQRRPAPEVESVTEDPGSVVRISFGERGSRLIEQGSEPFGVELPLVELQDVPGGPRQKPAVAACFGKRPPELSGVTLDELRRTLRRRLAPEAVDQAIGRDDLVRVHEQQGEQRGRFPGDRERTISPRDLQRPEHAELDRRPLQARPNVAPRPAY